MQANISFRSLFVALALSLSLSSVGAAQTESASLESAQIKPGDSVKRDLAGGESHSYLLTVASGRILKAVIAQGQQDLTAMLFGPDGERLGYFDSAWYGPEQVCYVAEAAGSYRLEIRPFNPTATRRSYELKLEEHRVPAPDDQTRISALRISAEGKRLIDQNKPQSLLLAKKKYEEALPQWREIGDRFEEAQALDCIGYIFWLSGGSAKGLEYYNQSLAIRREIGDLHGEGETLNNIAAAYSALGEKERALEYYNRALPLRPEGADRAATLGNIGNSYYFLGDPQKAVEHYKQALPLWRSAGSRSGEVNALLSLGSILRAMGENQQALDYLNQGGQIAREISDLRGEAHAANYLTTLYMDLGDAEKALDFSRQALSLFRTIGARSGEASALYNEGTLNSLAGDKEKALDLYNQALSIIRITGDRHTEVIIHLGLGKLYGESHENQKAFEHYNQALALLRKTTHPKGEALALVNLGLLHDSSKESQKALGYYKQALALWRELGDRNSEAATLVNIARAERNLGDLNEAQRHIEAALEIVETLRVKIRSQQLRASFLGVTRQYHELYIDVLMSRHRLHPLEGHDVAALVASERARARSLVEMLAEARADISEGIDASLLERERSLQKRINASAEYQYRLLSDKHTREQMEAVKKDLDSLIDESRQVESEIRKISPRYAALNYPRPLSLPEIRRMLDPRTLLLEYSLGEERSYLWAVTPSGIESFELPKRSEIEELARQAYKWLAEGETGAQLMERLASPTSKTPEWATDLSRILLGPVASRLGAKRLVIVADGALQYIPFASLVEPATGRRATARTRKPRPAAFTHLISNHEIVILPSATSLAALRRELAGRAPAPKTVAVIADPVFEGSDERIKKKDGNIAALNSRRPATPNAGRDLLRSAIEVGATDELQRLQRLIFSRREADEIMRLAGAGAGFKALDFSANRATALGSNLSHYRIIHFATHSLLNSQHPELSGIVLSLVDEEGGLQDGFLRLNDIYNLKIAADLVVLSACKTGLGKEIRGEGLIGLTRGFLYAGAPRVVASLWKVDDRATAELMKLFYQRMLREGLRPAAALRRAQIDMSKLPRWAPPYYWAGFTLQGEWK